MLPIASRVPDPAVRRLTTTLYGYAFLSDLVLLYPLYVVFFADTGLTVGQIASLFVIWSAAGVLFEVPSGAWADVLSRRLLLCLAPLVAAAGFALWVLVPSYPAFAVGFLLWGAGGALVSGALEALVWTELDRLGAVGRYARVLGRARTAGVLGVVVSGVLAGPVLAVGGYPVVGAASVLACLLATTVATRLPEHRAPTAARVPVYGSAIAVRAVGAAAPGRTSRTLSHPQTRTTTVTWGGGTRCGPECRRSVRVRRCGPPCCWWPWSPPTGVPWTSTPRCSPWTPASGRRPHPCCSCCSGRG
ncbi:MFS family permease [Micromonospora ureilytica]|uniref:MFS family permease n=1 Tax=Micromonospora ureilytica TaxID=709868 RepID=A0ABS0JG45_9ACTN|nr:MFS family permease [Micromonospora ureilytica]